MKKKSISKLEDHIGFWLRFVSNQVSHTFRKKLESMGFTVAEWVALRLLYDNDELSPGSIAETAGMTRGGMTKTMDKLLEKKLIKRTEFHQDRRYQKIRLTNEGIDLVPKLAKVADENDENYFSHLSERQKKDIVDLLRKIVGIHHLGKMPLD